VTRRLWIVGIAVFIVTLLFNVPAALIARLVDWPEGWEPKMITGTLWTGRAEQIGPLGPVVWRLRPWLGVAQVDSGFQQQAWGLSINGWPWAWQADLLPGAAMVTPSAGYALDGQWQGRLRVEGRGARCLSSEGELVGNDMVLLSPWMMVLGNARLSVDCREKLQLRAQVARDGQHRFDARFDPFARLAVIDGQVESEAGVRPLLIQAGLLRPGETHFERIFGKRP
jgi:general secretion pathway protein N